MSFANLLTLAVLLGASLALPAQSAISADPAPDKAAPAAMLSLQIPSHGAQMNALVYIASGSGPHPVVLLLHGFPGNERNLDLAQAMRRAGWDVVFFDYRGSWGTPGDFSFAHAMEDTQAAIAFVRDPATAKKLRADPGYLVLIGHSMGGMIAANIGARDRAIRAVGLISAANMAGRMIPAVQAGQQEQALPQLAKSLAAEGLAPLAGCTPESLARDLLAHAAQWNIPDLAPQLASRPMLVITSDDGNGPASDALVAELEKAGDREVTALHMATDHSYSDHRIALEEAVLKELAHLKPH